MFLRALPNNLNRSLINKKIFTVFEFFFKPTSRGRLIVLHPILCMRKKNANFVHKYEVQKLRKFERSSVSCF